MEPAEIQNEQFRELLENFINFLRKKCYKERPINKCSCTVKKQATENKR